MRMISENLRMALAISSSCTKRPFLHCLWTVLNHLRADSNVINGIAQRTVLTQNAVPMARSFRALDAQCYAWTTLCCLKFLTSPARCRVLRGNTLYRESYGWKMKQWYVLRPFHSRRNASGTRAEREGKASEARVIWTFWLYSLCDVNSLYQICKVLYSPVRAPIQKSRSALTLRSRSARARAPSTMNWPLEKYLYFN